MHSPSMSCVSQEMIPILFSFCSMPIQWSRNELGPLLLHFFFFRREVPRNDRTPNGVNISPQCSAPCVIWREPTSVRAGCCGAPFNLGDRQSGFMLKFFSPLRISASQCGYPWIFARQHRTFRSTHCLSLLTLAKGQI